MPAWPLTRLRRNAATPDDRAIAATVETVRGVRCLASLAPEAEALGLRVGQTLTDARAIHPMLNAIDAAPAEDAAALGHLAAWCERYTPLAAPDAPDGLWLDIAGCAHLHGGEDRLLDDFAQRLAAFEIPCRIALASTPGAAWAIAHAPMRPARVIVSPGGERMAIEALPVATLRLDPRTAAGLRRLGLKTVGELARQNRAEITARFGAAPMLRLDQALGAAEEAIAWPRPPTPWTERLAFVEPIGAAEDLRRALDLLATRLCQRLAAADRGGLTFAARFFRLDGAAPEITIATALPARDAKHVTKLLDEKLETVDPAFGIEAIALEAPRTAPLLATQPGLAGAPEAARALASTIDELVNRLGPGRVWRPSPRASHVPERAVHRAPPLAPAPSWEADPTQPRPIRLLRRPEPIDVIAPVPDDPPLQFRWRRGLHRVRAAAGPERIAAEWWRHAPRDDVPETDLIRDYYRVEDSEGARFWIFRTGLHSAARPVRWFLHGLFA